MKVHQEENQDILRKGSVLYKINQPKSKTLKLFKLGNKMVVPLYRLRILPLFGFGRIFLLIYMKGWKTGKRRIILLEYLKFNSKIFVFASRGKKSHWAKNIRLNPDNVEIRIGFRKRKVKPIFIDDEQEFVKIMKNYVKKRAKPAKSLFGWDPKKGDTIESFNFSRLMEYVVILGFEIEN